MVSIDRRLSGEDLLRAAASGEIPEWAEASPRRRAHMARVAELMGEWADQLGCDEAERVRWLAVGRLHDALRDADPEALRSYVGPRFEALPGPLLHGPAAAARLAGLMDEDAVNAIRYHTIGHPDLALLGKALYLADFLEPDRDFSRQQRADLRGRMPQELEPVLADVVEARIRHL
ncbi:MAG: HD domain-containing protein, partial [Gemmatimonadetes bacterium]|nr:HD domain-containing protein [Gemmatimonadota bacterium]